MILDTEQQRQLLVQLINAAQIPGTAVEAVAALKAAVARAELPKPQGG